MQMYPLPVYAWTSVLGWLHFARWKLAVGRGGLATTLGPVVGLERKRLGHLNSISFPKEALDIIWRRCTISRYRIDSTLFNIFVRCRVVGMYVWTRGRRLALLSTSPIENIERSGINTIPTYCTPSLNNVKSFFWKDILLR